VLYFFLHLQAATAQAMTNKMHFIVSAGNDDQNQVHHITYEFERRLTLQSSASVRLRHLQTSVSKMSVRLLLATLIGTIIGAPSRLEWWVQTMGM
jgi:hypothetical protein